MGAGTNQPAPFAVQESLSFFANIKPLAESLDSSSGIEDALLTRIERVTLGADVNFEHALGASYLERLTAGARYGSVGVIGVNTSLHDSPGAYAPLITGLCLSESGRFWRHNPDYCTTCEEQIQILVPSTSSEEAPIPILRVGLGSSESVLHIGMH